MKLHLDPTDRIETVQGTPCRLWAGTTGTGVPVHCWIAIVQPQTHDSSLLAAFDAELKALPAMRREMDAAKPPEKLPEQKELVFGSNGNCGGFDG